MLRREKRRGRQHGDKPEDKGHGNLFGNAHGLEAEQHHRRGHDIEKQLGHGERQRHKAGQNLRRAVDIGGEICHQHHGHEYEKDNCKGGFRLTAEQKPGKYGDYL